MITKNTQAPEQLTRLQASLIRRVHWGTVRAIEDGVWGDDDGKARHSALVQLERGLAVYQDALFRGGDLDALLNAAGYGARRHPRVPMEFN